jgi:hypothetical protein
VKFLYIRVVEIYTKSSKVGEVSSDWSAMQECFSILLPQSLNIEQKMEILTGKFAQIYMFMDEKFV